MTNASFRIRSAGAVIHAPDAIPVRPIDLTPGARLALAEGVIEPGATYRPHAHRSIEQATYVLEGRVRVISFDSDAARPRSVVLEPGQTTLTPPGETVQLECAGPRSARVLFMTAPPYPADHSDTVVLDRHRELTVEETEVGTDT